MNINGTPVKQIAPENGSSNVSANEWNALIKGISINGTANSTFGFDMNGTPVTGQGVRSVDSPTFAVVTLTGGLALPVPADANPKLLVVLANGTSYELPVSNGSIVCRLANGTFAAATPGAGLTLFANGTLVATGGGGGTPGGTNGQIQWNNNGAFSGANVSTGLTLSGGNLVATGINVTFPGQAGDVLVSGGSGTVKVSSQLGEVAPSLNTSLDNQGNFTTPGGIDTDGGLVATNGAGTLNIGEGAATIDTGGNFVSIGTMSPSQISSDGGAFATDGSGGLVAAGSATFAGSLSVGSSSFIVSALGTVTAGSWNGGGVTAPSLVIGAITGTLAASSGAVTAIGATSTGVVVIDAGVVSIDSGGGSFTPPTTSDAKGIVVG